MYNDMDVLLLCFIWVKIVMPICIYMDEYGDDLRILFCY